MEKAVVLLSGGLDSATVLSIAIKQGFDVYPVSFDYGQRHKIEIEYAKKISKHFGCLEKHLILPVPLDKIKGSALTDSSIAVPKNVDLGNSIPVTYVPARNTIFMSLALGYAEVVGANKIFIGANIIDYSNYPDCRPEYFDAFAKMANLATKAGVEGKAFEIVAPIINFNKAEIIRKGLENGVDFSMTFSCYDPTPEGKECGQCPSCLNKIKGFAEVS